MKNKIDNNTNWKEEIMAFKQILTVVFVAGLVGLSTVSGVNAEPPTVKAAIVNTPLDVTVVNVQPVNICADLTPASGSAQFIYAVPPGNRLVIEYTSFSSSGILDPGDIAQPSITTMVNGVPGTFGLGRIEGDVFIFANEGRQVKIYADPETDVVGGVATRNTSDPVSLCLSGQLIPE